MFLKCLPIEHTWPIQLIWLRFSRFQWNGDEITPFYCWLNKTANQLKTPTNVSWAFKMVSQFGSLGYTIMRKTADLTVVQKTIIDTLHKEGKPQKWIAKEAGCTQSAVSKHVNRKLSGRKKCGRKRCTTNRENHSLMRIVKQNRFKSLGEQTVLSASESVVRASHYE